MTTITLNVRNPASVPIPPSGRVTLFINASNQMCIKDEIGTIRFLAYADEIRFLADDADIENSTSREELITHHDPSAEGITTIWEQLENE